MIPPEQAIPNFSDHEKEVEPNTLWAIQIMMMANNFYQVRE